MKRILALLLSVFISISAPSLALGADCNSFVSEDGKSTGTACRDASGRLTIRSTDYIPISPEPGTPSEGERPVDITENATTILKSRQTITPSSIYDETSISARRKGPPLPPTSHGTPLEQPSTKDVTISASVHESSFSAGSNPGELPRTGNNTSSNSSNRNIGANSKQLYIALALIFVTVGLALTQYKVIVPFSGMGDFRQTVASVILFILSFVVYLSPNYEDVDTASWIINRGEYFLLFTGSALLIRSGFSVLRLNDNILKFLYALAFKVTFAAIAISLYLTSVLGSVDKRDSQIAA